MWYGDRTLERPAASRTLAGKMKSVYLTRRDGGPDGASLHLDVLTADSRHMSDAFPVTVVTGFLGAGKTTLVNRWLSESRRGAIAVIVNEHGAVGVDGELLKARARVLMEINGGCVCCTTQEELVAALDAVIQLPEPPERVLIETSGAASPAGVLKAISGGGRNGLLTLDGVVAVFDATRIEDSLERGLALEQLGYADVVVLSRSDECTPDVVRHAEQVVTARNGAAVVVEAAHGVIVSPMVRSFEELLARRDAWQTQRLSPFTVGDHVYESIAFLQDGELDGERFAEFVETEVAEFAGRIFRIKGILAVAGLERRMILQGVADSVELTFGDEWGDTPRHSRLVIVGFGLERDALRRGFNACIANSE